MRINHRTQKILNLLFLRKALREESYEECSSWARKAMNAGASRGEIFRVIRQPGLSLEEIFVN